MKTIFFLSFQLFITVTAVSQWMYETTLPNAGTYVPRIWQVCVIDSSVSCDTCDINVNQNQYYPYFAKRTCEGWQYISTNLDSSVKGYCFTATDSLNVWLGTFHPDEIYYSSNGGSNWVLQYHVADTGHVQGIMFCKQNSAIGYAYATLSFIGLGNGVRILKTTNGGINWYYWDFVNYGYLGEDNSICVIDSNYAWFGSESLLDWAVRVKLLTLQMAVKTG